MPNDEITFRLLAKNDAAVLDRVDEDVFDHAIRTDSVRAFLNDPNSMIAVAVDDGFVVGMATALTYVHPDKPLQLFINEVGVAGSYQRCGIGKRLVFLLLERGKEIGCKEAWVATEEENLPARALFSSVGGEEDPSRAVVFTYSLRSARATSTEDDSGAD